MPADGLFKWLTCSQHGTPTLLLLSKDPWFLQMFLMHRAGSRQRPALEKVQRFPGDILEGGPLDLSPQGEDLFLDDANGVRRTSASLMVARHQGAQAFLRTTHLGG